MHGRHARLKWPPAKHSCDWLANFSNCCLEGNVGVEVTCVGVYYNVNSTFLSPNHYFRTKTNKDYPFVM